MLPHTGAPLPFAASAEAHSRRRLHRQERQAASVLCQVQAGPQSLGETKCLRFLTSKPLQVHTVTHPQVFRVCA